ncbi:hypothetical protein COLO4_29955 [Corchorus olitorius]|uniref:Uncharacterized protein n=1 Tax=Corchorus olitorius TaxID=93759 RepID=A0A1R3HC84_9ROSI|nr:hypothetical protein COLO4_29955 [Corchorus olitorius]
MCAMKETVNRGTCLRENGDKREWCVEGSYPNWDKDEEEYSESMWAVSWPSR